MTIDWMNTSDLQMALEDEFGKDRDMRFHVGQMVRIIDNSNMRGETGEIRRKGHGVWWVWLEMLGREIPFDESEIEPQDEEK